MSGLFYYLRTFLNSKSDLYFYKTLKQLKSILFINGKFSKIIGVPAVVTLLSVVVTSLIYMIFQYVNPWQGMELGVAGNFEEFCELNRMNELFREPVNTISNLAFLFYGAVCIAFYRNDLNKRIRSNLLVEFPEYSLIMGIFFLYLAFGSFFYHASLTIIGQHHDMTATYSVATFPVIFNAVQILVGIGNRKSFSARKNIAQIGFFILLITPLFFYAVKWKLNANIALPIIFSLIFITSLLTQKFISGKSYPVFLLLGFISLATAFGLWYADKNNFWCNPYGFLQGHAVWHILTGLAAFFIYLYLRSERKKLF